MTNQERVLFVGLTIASVLLFVITVVWFIRRVLGNRKADNKSGISNILKFSGLFILSIWVLRFAVGYSAIVVYKGNDPQLTYLEEIVHSLLGALRTFSLEEDYAQYIVNLKTMMVSIIPNNSQFCGVLQGVTVAYASLLNLMAPIAGGTIILEFLANVFPKLKLVWSYVRVWRPKYFFSELNASSLTLAKSIYDNEKDERPILIFTDAYINEEKEKESELLLEAKKYGAICIRDDLLHIKKNKRGVTKFFLMDENEFGNLQTLIGLTNEGNLEYIMNSQIYLFVQSDAYVRVEKQINESFNTPSKKRILKRHKKPTIIPIRGYRNLVQNLFVDVPLYEPLINNEDKRSLNITIIGNGNIGTEAFLNAYWIGQMLISQKDSNSMSDCNMTINVVSKDSQDVFWSKIDYINPEIKATVTVLGSDEKQEDKPLLRYDDEGNKNNPYCNVRYKCADVKTGYFWDGEQEILNSDYFIVALGNDADNITIADKLRYLIGKRHIENAGKTLEQVNGNTGNVVITYAVFDPEVAINLNKGKYYSCVKEGKTDIYMHAFGSLDQVYSYENIYMSRYNLLAESVGSAYNKTQANKKLQQDNEDREVNSNSNYNYWANMARAMHIKYKVFSLGFIKSSVFDCISEQEELAHKDYVSKQCKNYIQMVLSDPSELNDDKKHVYNDLEEKKHLLAWLEHRRWNAFTRIMGYQHASAQSLFSVKGSQKDMELKLHSCLVEARRPSLEDGTYIHAEFLPNGKVNEDTLLATFSTQKLDCLDQVSYQKQKYNGSKTDYKKYDYYRYEFDEYINDEDISKLL